MIEILIPVLLFVTLCWGLIRNEQTYRQCIELTNAIHFVNMRTIHSQSPPWKMLSYDDRTGYDRWLWLLLTVRNPYDTLSSEYLDALRDYRVSLKQDK